jgi:hypothetical protein
MTSPSEVSIKSHSSIKSIQLRDKTLQDALFFIPKQEEFPLSEEEVWSDSQALEFILDDLLSLKEDPHIKRALKNMADSPDELYRTPLMDVANIQVPARDPATEQRVAGGEKVPPKVVRKFENFIHFYTFLNQIKFPYSVNGVIWQKVVTVDKFKAFVRCFGTSLKYNKDNSTWSYFHPKKQRYVSSQEYLDGHCSTTAATLAPPEKKPYQQEEHPSLPVPGAIAPGVQGT